MEQEVLHPYQLEGAEFLAARDTAGLFDIMGLGKSAQAIRACDEVGAEYILVICPAVARVNWLREFQKFSKVDRDGVAVMTTKQPFGDAKIIVVSYDLVTRSAIFNRLMMKQFDALIIDEAHYLKNPQAKRTTAILGRKCDAGKDSIASRCKRAYCLTGTPFVNNASELWPMLHAFYPQATHSPSGHPMSHWAFTRAYCVVRDNQWGGVKIIKNKNAAQLREKMKGWFIRRKEDQIELPPVREDHYYLDYDRALDDLLERETEIDTGYYKRVMQKPEVSVFKELMDDEHLARAMRICGRVKARLVADLLLQELNWHDKKVVLMSWHRDSMDILGHALQDFGVVQISGSENGLQKQEAVDAFQNDPKVRVANCQIKAAGTAITLTAAPYLDFVELAWTPGDNAQAKKRVDRIGQTRPVRVRYLQIPNSIDEILTQVLARKTADARELIDGE